ncbi:MAG: NAD(P) transhydrogenase subunit alpha [Trinickia sp.]
MHIGVPAETRPYETRVAATPETVNQYVRQGHRVTVQRGAGVAARLTDEAFSAAGAQLGEAAAALNADIVLKVQSPTEAELRQMKREAVLIGMLDPFNDGNRTRLAEAGVVAFALETVPRTTRAHSVDVLSSQASIAGYKAVLIAADLFPRFMPMLVTAAGTVKAARVLVLGAGVAGLHAIATAKRLGAVVEASDVRPATKQQIESLGAKFVDVPLALHERARAADIVITTALTPGRDAPMLLSAKTVQAMRPGSVIVDLAAGRGAELPGLRGMRGGNCPLTEPDKVMIKHGVTIVGHTNLPAMVPAEASSLYARNLFDFLKLIVTREGTLDIDLNDEIVAATLLAGDGAIGRKAA